jgi:excisionase family DNA binding protein
MHTKKNRDETKNEQTSAGGGTQLLSVAKTALRLNLCRKSIENLIKRGELKPVRLLRRVLIKESQVEALIRRRSR